MAAGLFRQFSILFWKNWQLQRRNKAVTCVEIGLPWFMCAMIILMRILISSDDIKEPTIWNPFNQSTIFPFPNTVSTVTNNNPKWKIAFSPDIPEVRNVMLNFVSRLNDRFYDGDAGLSGFLDEGELVDFMTSDTPDAMEHYGGVVFINDFPGDNFPEKIYYKIRLRALHLSQERDGITLSFGGASKWLTDYLMPVDAQHGPREQRDPDGGEPYYNQEGFLGAQWALEMALSEELSNENSEDFHVELQRYPYPPYRDDGYVYALELGMYAFTYLMLLPSVFFITKELILEKERKLKEVMKLMGLSTFINWLSWIVKYLIFLGISMVVVTASMFIPFQNGAAVINDSSFILIFLFLMIYAFTTICYCCLVSVFFSKASNGAMFAGIIFVMSMLVYNITSGNYGDMTAGSKLMLGWMHNVIMAYGWRLIAQYESQGNGLNFSTMSETPSLQENLTMVTIYFVLLLDAVIYLVIAWYVEKLAPGEFGIPEKWYFPCSPSYWCGGSKKKVKFDEEGGIEGEPENQYIERTATADQIPGIRIKNLRKEFKKKKRTHVAVAGTHLDMYEGQITALLGHNGAGKTTTISMLTGFVTPSGGTATVNGYDIRTDMSHVRSSMGLCPQHDVLFDILTVKEHLEFFAQLKGCEKKDLKKEVTEMIELLQLVDKTNVQSCKLSGGMKRKLSVGIALIHGSKIVILDEPSSGVDPAARRQLWDILQSQRKGRTMLLTTHFMDEADFLGDRIAIMASGQVKCCGSGLFLKGKYGVGYHMTIVKAEGCNSKKIQKAVQRYVPTATVESNISAELSFLLPSDQASQFEEMFAHLEDNKEQLKINSYGASITTMEEVFLKVGQEDQDKEVKDRIRVGNEEHKTGYNNASFTNSNGNLLERQDTVGSSPERHDSLYRQTSNLSNGEPDHNQIDMKNLKPVFGKEVTRSTGSELQARQFRAMFTKRVIHTMRNRVVTIGQLVMPIVFAIFAGVIFKALPSGSDPDPRPMNFIELMEESKQYIVYSTETASGLTGELATYYRDFLAGNVTDIVDLLGSDKNDLIDHLWNIGADDRATYHNEYMVSAAFSTMLPGDGVNVTAMFNNQAYHTPSLTLSMVSNAILQLLTSGGHSMELTNHPLPRSEQQKVEDDVGSAQLTSYIVMSQIVNGMSILVATFVVFLVKESSVKAKHIQFVSGVHSFNFWLSTYLWDLVNYFIPAVIIVPVLAAFDMPGTTGFDAVVILIVLIFYAWAVIPGVYCFSFVFDNHANAFVGTTILNMFLGNAFLTATNNLMIPGSSTYEVGEALDWLFTITFPTYTMARALQQIMINGYNKDSCAPYTTDVCDALGAVGSINPCCPDCNYCIVTHDNVIAWELPGILRYIFFMVMQGCILFLLLAVLESGVMSTLWQAGTADVYDTEDDEEVAQRRHEHGMLMRRMSHTEDNDVMEERMRVTQTPLNTLMEQNSLIISQLRKFYGNFRAVNKISVGVPQGECFGLLGVNGAGKTTTFKMMTGDELISSGAAYLDGFSVSDHIKEVQQRLGYCPQFDALIEQMTVTEHLYMYARLRGVAEHQIQDIADDLMDTLLLKDHAHKNAKDLSGGNKRKLSTAIALVGDPPIVFLDEPTTGMDPLARRLLWDSLNKVRASGRTLVLTSHSMEECEALCTRLAIMVNGEFKCLGSTQHLKNKFGEGYSLMARVTGHDQQELESNTQRLMEFIEESFPGCELKDMHQGLVHYQIDQTTTTWSKAFGTIERNKVEYSIKDYSVSQTTLEQVFISFARSQTAPVFSDVGSATKCWHCCRFVCCCGCTKKNKKKKQTTVERSHASVTPM